MKRRETWVEATKVLACAFVALYTLFQSLVRAEIIGSSAGYIWFSLAVQYVVVPLFFVYNGYVFQKGKPIKNTDDWLRNVGRKFVELGVPFVIFCCANWLIGYLFLAETDADLVRALVVSPATPYWYYFALFLIFLFTPTMNTKLSAAILCALALLVKALTFVWRGLDIFAIDMVLEYWFWFVTGMVLAFVNAPTTMRKQKGVQRIGIALALVFFVSSIAVIIRSVYSAIISFIFGVMGCSAVLVLLITAKFSDNFRKTVRKIGEYAVPVLLMHTIFAGLTRGLLLKGGITNSAVHIVAGLTISFDGPILAGFILKKLKWAEFILYPGKFIKFGSKKEEMSHGKKA